MSLLEYRALSVAFHQGEQTVQAVSDLSLTIEKGEFFALVGESGSGKSVSAQAILQLLPQSAKLSGEILWKGERLDQLSPAAMRRLRGNQIAMIFQEPMSALNPLHSIGRQIDEMLVLHQPQLSKSERLARTHELLDQVGLAHFAERLSAYPHQLSGGERQRVMIAMAMANDPQLLIADEPTTALDVTLQAQILALLKELQQQRGLSVLLITHDLSIVRHLADRVGVMRAGALVEQGRVDDVFEQPRHAYTRQLLDAMPSGSPPPLPQEAPTLLSCVGLDVFYDAQKGWWKRSPGKQAVADISLSISKGETLGIVGESGSGKTTLAMALLRLLPSSGRVLYLGDDLNAAKASSLRALRSQLQVVFQDPYASLNPRMNVQQIICEGLRVHQPELSRAQMREKAEAIMDSVGLDREMLLRYPHEFSGGQRQRISIARAMILAPALVVLDEPTSALDVSIQAQIIDLLREFQRKQQISYLFISHDLRVIRALSHRVVVMQQGKVVEMAQTAQLFSHPQSDYTRQLIRSAQLEQD